MSCLRGTRWHRPHLFFIFVTFLLYSMALILAGPIYPQIVIVLCDGDLSRASLVSGMMAGLSALATFLVAPLLGAVSDHVGRRPVLLLSLVGMMLEMAAMASWQSLHLWMLIFARVVAGMVNSFIAMGYASISDVSTPEHRSAGFASLGVAMGLALVSAPMLGGWLATNYFLSLPVLVSMILTLLNVIFVMFVFVESRTEQNGKGTQLSCKRLNPFRSFMLLSCDRFTLGMAVVLFIVVVGEDGIMDIFILFVKYAFHWGPMQIGEVMSVLGACFILVQGFGVRILLKWMRESYVILFGLFIHAASIPCYGLINNGYYLYPVLIFRSLATVANPTMQGAISQHYDQSQQGEVLGMLSGLKTICAFIGPLVFNNLFSYYTVKGAWPMESPRIVFFFASFLFCIAFVLCCILLAVERRMGAPVGPRVLVVNEGALDQQASEDLTASDKERWPLLWSPPSAAAEANDSSTSRQRF
ncbi:putative Tetracyclineefflux transporter [Balamuthia mandrillaris]